jgi:hypothetical protein
MLAGTLFQAGSFLKKFFFPLRPLHRLQAATHDDKKEEKNPAPLKAINM